MKSLIAKSMKMDSNPIAIIFTDDKPDNSLMFGAGKRGCVVQMFVKAVEGKTVAFSRDQVGCPGAISGLCFGSSFDKIPGGIEYFLSTGRGAGYPEGEKYIKTPELAKKWLDSLPITNIRYEYVVFKPLNEVDVNAEKPVLVSFYTDAHRISALTILANYARENHDNIIVRFASACQSVVMLPYYYSRRNPQKAVLGLFDITTRSMIKADHLSFTVPWKMFNEMEANVEGSFLESKLWKKVIR